MNETYPITLDSLEALYLSDQLSMHTNTVPLGDREVIHPWLQLKIGSALLYTKDHVTKNYEVEFTEKELWALVEYAKSSVQIGSTKVGTNLADKFYRTLIGIYVVEAKAKGLKLYNGRELENTKLYTQLTDLVNGIEDDDGNRQSNES